MLRIVVLLSVVAVVTFGIGFGITRQSAVAQEATPGAEAAEMAEVLVVQSFAAGRLDPAGEPGRATLTLEPPVGDAVYLTWNQAPLTSAAHRGGPPGAAYGACRSTCIVRC